MTTMTIDISFKYANHENRQKRSHTVNATTKIGDLKKMAFEDAPDEYKALRGPGDVRLVSMGKRLSPDESKLKEFNLPTFAHPTPIHVMLSKEGVEFVHGKPGSKKCNIL
eukprot:gb/GECG01002724.1/.p1 GENE.gb/GECG01002724.1/~~gb/GECG01002724.1/.p1  ORF type:complete len:110 (+),score=17.98 gb/GECG01002724.1/:1-330(+)